MTDRTEPTGITVAAAIKCLMAATSGPAAPGIREAVETLAERLDSAEASDRCNVPTMSAEEVEDQRAMLDAALRHTNLPPPIAGLFQAAMEDSGRRC